MQQHVTQFAALAVDAQMGDATPLLEVADGQRAQFGAPQAVIQQGRQDRA